MLIFSNFAYISRQNEYLFPFQSFLSYYPFIDPYQKKKKKLDSPDFILYLENLYQYKINILIMFLVIQEVSLLGHQHLLSILPLLQRNCITPVPTQRANRNSDDKYQVHFQKCVVIYYLLFSIVGDFDGVLPGKLGKASQSNVSTHKDVEDLKMSNRQKCGKYSKEKEEN